MADRKIQVTLTAVDKTKRAFASVSRSLSNIGGKLKNFGSQFGAVFGIGGGLGAASIVDMADEMERLVVTAEKLGTTTDELSKLEFAAGKFRVQADNLQDALQNMVERLSEAATESGEAAEALEELELNADELSTLAPEEQFRILADALKNVGNQGDRVRLIIQLFEGEAANLTPLLIRGSEAIDAFGQELEELGGVVDQQAAEAAAKLNRQLRGLSKNFDILRTQALNAIVPFANAVAEFAKTQDLAKAGAVLEDSFGNLPEGLRRVTVEMYEVERQLRALQEAGEQRILSFDEQVEISNLKARFAAIKAVWIQENERITKIQDDAEKARSKNTEENEKQTLEEIKLQQAAKAKARQDYVDQLQAIADEERSVLESIANAGREIAAGAEAAQIGGELDPGDLFIRLQEGFRQLAGGDTAGAQRTIESIRDAIRILTEESKSFGDTITAEQLRQGLSELASKIADVRRESLVDPDKARKDAKEASDAAKDEIEQELRPEITVIISEDSKRQIVASVQEALQGQPFEVDIVPRAREVVPGVFETAPGEFGASPYPLSAGEGHESP